MVVNKMRNQTRVAGQLLSFAGCLLGYSHFRRCRHSFTHFAAFVLVESVFGVILLVHYMHPARRFTLAPFVMRKAPRSVGQSNHPSTNGSNTRIVSGVSTKSTDYRYTAL